MKIVSTRLVIVTLALVCMLSELSLCGRNEKINPEKKTHSLPELKSLLDEKKISNFRKTVSEYLPKFITEPDNESPREKKKKEKREKKDVNKNFNFDYNKYMKQAQKDGKKRAKKRAEKIKTKGPVPRNSSPYRCLANLCNTNIVA